MTVKVDVQPGCQGIEVIVRCPSDGPDVRRIVAAVEALDDTLTGVKDGATHVIEWRDVLYCESVDKRTFIYTANDVYETAERLYEIEDRFGFARISRSQVVNIRQIEALRPEFARRLELVMANDEKLIVNRFYAKTLKERLGLK